jgi:amino acid transporter
MRIPLIPRRPRLETIALPSAADPGPPADGGPRVPAQSGLHRELKSFGVLLLTMSCLSPVYSIYGVGSDVLQHAGTGAAIYVADLAPGVAPQAVTFGSLAAALAVALLAVRTSALVTGLFLAIEMLAVLALIVAGMWHPTRSLVSVIAHPMALNAAGILAPATIGSLALGGVSAAYATAGGNQAIAFGEELRDPHRHMGRVVLIAGLIGAFATAIPIIAVVLGMSDPVSIFASPAPLSTFISSMAGPAAGRALSAGVALAVFNALIAQIMFSARLFFSLGRDEIFTARVNRMLARVHAISGAPIAATLVVGVISALCCLLKSHLLVVFSSALVVYSLALVSLAVFVGGAKGSTGQSGYWRSTLYPLAPVLGLCLALGFGVADLLDAEDGRPSILILGAVLLSALVWYHLVLKRRPEGWAPKLI